MSTKPILMEIKGLMLDPASNTPIVILRDAARTRLLPIWIGVFEANAIAMQLEEAESTRPMTHDLFHQTLEMAGLRLQRALIRDLQDNTFYATLRFAGAGDEPLEIDARPSDALALALRAGAEVYVLPAVLEKAEAIELIQRVENEDELKQWLADVDPEELGEYPM